MNITSNLLLFFLPYVASLYNHAASSGSPPKEMLQSVITTIPKPGKDPQLTQNYRPISLLNTYIKIFSQVIARRLLPLLPALKHPGQVGFIHGRQAPDATKRLITLIHSLEHQKMPSLLLSLDAEKEFYRVHWGYLKVVLQKFGITG